MGGMGLLATVKTQQVIKKSQPYWGHYGVQVVEMLSINESDPMCFQSHERTFTTENTIYTMINPLTD